MWIVIILLVVVLYLVKFFYDKNQQAAKIAKEGGMRRKYQDLIEFLMSVDSRCRVLQETSESITVGLVNVGGSTLFDLTQTFGKLTVQWKVDSPIFGKHKMEWDFPEYGDQGKMHERILNDTEKYLQNLMGNLGIE